jgi:hypothetical protein
LWPFVVGALVFLAGWMFGNGSHGFDPCLFILLNLVPCAWPRSRT